MADQCYIGTVKSFNPEKGWGHIECDETHALYGKDIFLMRSQFVGMDSVNRGDEVQFMVQDGQRGPEACNIQSNTSTGAHDAAAFGALGQGGPSSTSCTGTVKSWNPEKGWGHIECGATHALFGKDVFLMRSHLVGCMDVNKGQQVSFSYTEGPRGPEAVNVEDLSGSHFAGDGYSGNTGNYALMGAMGGDLGQNAAAMEGMACTGVVKSFDEDKGWGHISCDETRALYQKDMFFMRSALNGASVMPGDTVQFGITMGIKGPEASPLNVLGRVGANFTSNVNAAGQVYCGTVKMFNAEKGWGFLVSAESQQDWGKDIFVHSKEFAGILPRVGNVCEFSVMPGQDGRPEAYGVTAVTGGGSAPVAARGLSGYAPY